MKRRFRAVYRIEGEKDDGFLSKAEWYRISESAPAQDQKDAAEMFCWLMVEECRKLANKYDALDETEDQTEFDERDKMLNECKQDEVKVILDNYTLDNTNIHFATQDSIIETIKDELGVTVSKKKVVSLIRQAFPNGDYTQKREKNEAGKHEQRFYGLSSKI